MSLILAIETGTDICSVGIAKDGELLSLRESDEGRDHARKVGVFVDELLRETDIAPDELDAVAVGKGPGSYTGLRIGVSFTRGRAIMPELIVAFQKQYPQMAVTLTEAANDTLQTLLLNGDIDLEIAEFHKAPQEIALQDFYDEHIVLCFSDALLERCGIDFDAEEPRMRKGDLTALQNCPFVMGRADDINGRIGRALLSKGGVKPIVKAMSGNIETLLALCEEGVGACFSPENLVHTALGREQASKLHLLRFEQGGVYPIRFGYLKRSYQWSIVEAFIRMARESLQE